MFLSHVPICIIMILGRWSSDTFLKYLRPQVLGFSRAISSEMLSVKHYKALADHDPFDARRIHLNCSAANIIHGSNRSSIIEIPRESFTLGY